MKKLLSVVLAVFLLSGCCNCGRKYAAPFTATTWQLQQLDGHNVAVKLTADEVPYLVFGSGGRFSGSGGCNRIGGGWQKSADGKIAFTEAFSTKMFCPNDAIEQQFLAALNEVDSFAIDGIYLYLFTDGALRMVLVKK